MDNKPLPGAIPSPFMPDMSMASQMMEEVEAVTKKYGYKQVFLAVGKPSTGTTADFFSQSNSLSDGMVECLKDSVREMQRELDKHKDDGAIA